MHGDAVSGHTERNHVGFHGVGHCKHPVRCLARCDDLRDRRRVFSPKMDIRPARLDRHRHIENAAEFDGGRTVGEKEFGVDDIEGEGFAQTAKDRLDCSHYGTRIVAPPGTGNMRETRAIDGEAVPHFHRGQGRKCPVARVELPERGDADGGHHLQFNVGMRRQPACLQFDEQPETGTRCIGKQCAESQDAAHDDAPLAQSPSHPNNAARVACG